MPQVPSARGCWRCHRPGDGGGISAPAEVLVTTQLLVMGNGATVPRSHRGDAFVTPSGDWGERQMEAPLWGAERGRNRLARTPALQEPLGFLSQGEERWGDALSEGVCSVTVEIPADFAFHMAKYDGCRAPGSSRTWPSWKSSALRHPVSSRPILAPAPCAHAAGLRFSCFAFPG